MRTSFGMGLVAICLIVAGCKLPVFRPRSDSSPAFNPGGGGSGGGGSGGGGSTAPSFPGDSDHPVEGKTTSGNLPPRVNGFLAGQVLDGYNRRVATAQIEIIDLDDPKEKVPLTKQTNPQGYFEIKGLNPGHRYMLVARGKEGTRSIEGRMRVVPPNPKVVIYAEETDITPTKGTAEAPQSTPAEEQPKPPPSKPAEKAGEKQGPAAKLEAPIKTPATNGSAPPAPAPPAPTPPEKSDTPGKVEGAPKIIREQIGRDNPGAGEFHKFPSADVNIQGPGRDAPGRSQAPNASPGIPAPPTQSDRATGEDSPAPTPPPPGSTVQPPAQQGARSDVPIKAPACVRVGNRVHNLALSNLDGEVWELRKHRKGRLVLLDFWFTSCPPCRDAIPHLVGLQRKYGSYGLSVVGVAYEKGTPAQQADKVRGFRERMNINYVTLLGSGTNCPVRTQMLVSQFPTLVLIDETGLIVWRSEGLDQHKAYELEMAVRRGLGMPGR